MKSVILEVGDKNSCQDCFFASWDQRKFFLSSLRLYTRMNVYIYICIYMTCIHMCIFDVGVGFLKVLEMTVDISRMWMRQYIYVYVYIYICVYMYTYVCTYIYICVCIYIATFIDIYTYIQIDMNIYVVYTYTYVCMYIYNALQHTATYCITLQHTATRCNSLQHTCRTGTF